MTENPEPAKTCQDCAHASDAAKDKMPGWLTCAWAEKWTYIPPQSVCVFNPVRWQPKVAK